MRVLLTSWAWGSHFLPMVPLGWALRAAGHEVMVLSTNGLIDVITAAGLPAISVGPDVDVAGLMRQTKSGDLAADGAGQGSRHVQPITEGHDDIRLRRAREGAAVFVPPARAMLPPALEFARGWRPDLVVFEPTTYVGPLLGAILGVPSVRHLWTVDFTATIDRFADELVGDLAAAHGIARPSLLGTVTVDPCPQRLQTGSVGRRSRVRHIPYNGPARYPSWLTPDAGRRRLCLTWGTSLNGLGLSERMFLPPRIIDALAQWSHPDIDEIIVPTSAQQRELIGACPDHVRLIDPVALHLVLPHCAAIIHQGGGGTMMTAAGLGVGQVVVPQLPDQTLNARLLADSGAGHLVQGQEFGADTLRAAVDESLDCRTRSAAKQLATEMAALPTPADLVAGWTDAGSVVSSATVESPSS